MPPHQRDIWDQTDRYLRLSGYLNYRLCGSFVASVGSQVGYLPFDYKKLAWARASDWKWQALAVVQIFRGYWMVNWFKQQFGH